ncbi:ciliary microtubule inner protein 3 [Guaruba guarouba]
MASQRTKPTETPGKDHERPKGTEETKAKQDVSHSLPILKSQPSPAQHHRDRPLAAHCIPFVAHYGNRQPNSFRFLFYQSTCSNSYSPFCTAQKATCGYRFHRDTDHARKVMDVPSANVVKWRPIRGKKPQAKPINPKK